MPYYRFTGKELDPETGLYYYGARYYDPVLSKWISADPILGKYLPTGNKDSDNNLPGAGGVYRSVNINLYHYGLNNPLKYVDPTGQFSTETGGKYDVFRSTKITTGYWALDNTVMPLVSEVHDAAALLANGAINGLGYAIEGAHWLATDVLGGSEGDFEGLGVWFGLFGGPLSQSGRLSSAAKIGTEFQGAKLSTYSGGKTAGVLRMGGKDIPLASGWNGPATSMPRGTPGMNIVTKSHVEGHASALMRQTGSSEATLYINQVPCAGATGCGSMLPRMLPEGAQLRVVGPGGYDKIFTGLPD